MNSKKIEDKLVSRAGYKLIGFLKSYPLDFKGKIILDVGSSTGGFTQVALLLGAKKITSVELGTRQLSPILKNNDKIRLYEKTNILDCFGDNHFSRNTLPDKQKSVIVKRPDIVLADCSFTSIRPILTHISKNIIDNDSYLVILFKPQFEALDKDKHKGIIKNNKIRRRIIADFEIWLKRKFRIVAKQDSLIEGTYGNEERFYLLKKSSK
jgi:23S rRNA (cytidine1920-2'-O)/16S rRNA (cytidine1409-2'-O)-methyltransferase